MTLFGPEYPKIQTVFKRDERNVIVPGDLSRVEFQFDRVLRSLTKLTEVAK